MQAVLHLIGVQLNDKQYVLQLLHRLAKEYAIENELVLTLSLSDEEVVRTNNGSHPFKLKGDERLSPGDYRLELAHGSESFCLRSGLIQLV